MKKTIGLMVFLWSSVAFACDPGESSYGCYMDCDPIASNTPQSAWVTVCADSPENAQAQALYPLGLQYGCFPIDNGAPGPQDDISCGECGEWCAPQGGMLPQPNAWTNNAGGLLGGLEATLDAIACTRVGDDIVCLAPTCPEIPTDRCQWVCSGLVLGGSSWPFPAWPVSTLAMFDCGVSESDVVANAHHTWDIVYPNGIIATSMTACSPTLRVSPVNPGDCQQPQDEEDDTCDWYCNGMTFPFEHVSSGGNYPHLLPPNPRRSDGFRTPVESRCPRDSFDYDDAEEEAKVIAADTWDAWISGQPMSEWPTYTDRDKTQCVPTLPEKKGNYVCRGWKKAVGGNPSAGRCEPDFLQIETPIDAWDVEDDWFTTYYACGHAEASWLYLHSEQCVCEGCEPYEPTGP